MRMQKSTAGIAALEIVLVIGVLIAAGLTAWWVYERQPGAGSRDTGTAHATTAATNTGDNAAAAPAISSSADLDTALRVLDQSNSASDNTDLKALNSQTAAF